MGEEVTWEVHCGRSTQQRRHKHEKRQRRADGADLGVDACVQTRDWKTERDGERETSTTKTKKQEQITPLRMHTTFHFRDDSSGDGQEEGVNQVDVAHAETTCLCIYICMYLFRCKFVYVVADLGDLFL